MSEILTVNEHEHCKVAKRPQKIEMRSISLQSHSPSFVCTRPHCVHVPGLLRHGRDGDSAVH
eukprot:5189846-Amphidinium_carterae.1